MLLGRIVVVVFPVNVADIARKVVHVLVCRLELLQKALDTVQSLALILQAGQGPERMAREMLGGASCLGRIGQPGGALAARFG